MSWIINGQKFDTTEFGELTKTEQKNLCKMTKKFLDTPKGYDEQLCVVKQQLLEERNNYKLYSTLVAHFIADELGSTCVPKKLLIITDKDNNVVCKLHKYVYEPANQKQKLDFTTFLPFNYGSKENLLPITNLDKAILDLLYIHSKTSTIIDLSL